MTIKNQAGLLWWQCHHCSAIFRADNNLCISCGAPSTEYTKPLTYPYADYSGSSAHAVVSCNIVSSDFWGNYAREKGMQ